MKKIFYIMGKSATGKDTLYNKILEDKKLKLNSVTLHTTRPKRIGEIDGEDYFFVDKKVLEDLRDKNEIIEERVYHTVHGDWYYFLTKNNGIDLSKNNYLMIGTIESFGKMRDYFGKDVIVPIYIEVEDGIRLKRALDRETAQKEPKYLEMCRRFIADAEDFSENNLTKNEINIKFDNINLDETIKKIKDYIYSMIEE